MFKLLRAICVVLLGGLLLVPFSQIVLRDVFQAPFVGSGEFTRFLLICTVFLAYPLVVRQNENIVMAEFHSLLPPRIRRGLDFLIALLSCAACGLIAVVTALSIGDNLNNSTPTLGIPFWIFLGACFVGFAGAFVVHLIHLRRPPAKDDSVSF